MGFLGLRILADLDEDAGARAVADEGAGDLLAGAGGDGVSGDPGLACAVEGGAGNGAAGAHAGL